MRTERQDKLLQFVVVQHGEQKRKYTGAPYTVHLESVADLAEEYQLEFGYEIGLCHDLFEDTACTDTQLRTALTDFRYSIKEVDFIVSGVWDLTDRFLTADYPFYNRKQRKAMEAARMKNIPVNSQSIKYCDLIDNTSSTREHDEEFAKVYLREKAMILKVMNKGNAQLYRLAIRNVQDPQS